MISLARRPLGTFALGVALTGFIAFLSGPWVGSAPVRLDKARLVRAGLAGQNLQGARFSRADLQEADLTMADLRRADFRGANLRSANLALCNLRGAQLQGADLRAANLQFADLNQATLDGATFDRTTTWPEGFDAAASGAVETRPLHAEQVVRPSRSSARNPAPVPAPGFSSTHVPN